MPSACMRYHDSHVCVSGEANRAGQARGRDLPAWDMTGLHTTSPADCASLPTFRLGASVSASLKWRDNTQDYASIVISWRAQVIALAGLPSGSVCLGAPVAHGGSYCHSVPKTWLGTRSVAEHGECWSIVQKDRAEAGRWAGDRREAEGARQCLEVS